MNYAGRSICLHNSDLYHAAVHAATGTSNTTGTGLKAVAKRLPSTSSANAFGIGEVTVFLHVPVEVMKLCVEGLFTI